MKFLRDSLTKKALLLFTLLMVILIVAAVVLIRKEVETLPTNLFLGIIFGLLLSILLAFLLDVMVPLGRVTKQVKYLLTGKNYQRLEPTTVDEIGILTHFFNEITKDLEKISFDGSQRRAWSPCSRPRCTRESFPLLRRPCPQIRRTGNKESPYRGRQRRPAAIGSPAIWRCL